MNMNVLRSLTEREDMFTGAEFYKVFDFIEKNGRCV